MRITVIHDPLRYIKRTQTPYNHPKVSYHDIQTAIPQRLFARPLGQGLWLVTRDFVMQAIFLWSATNIEPLTNAIASMATGSNEGVAYYAIKYSIKTPLWMAYWFFMGIQGAGIWFNGHEVCNLQCFPVHDLILSL
jgi:hypothetical protein